MLQRWLDRAWVRGGLLLLLVSGDPLGVACAVCNAWGSGSTNHPRSGSSGGGATGSAQSSPGDAERIESACTVVCEKARTCGEVAVSCARFCGAARPGMSCDNEVEVWAIVRDRCLDAACASGQTAVTGCVSSTLSQVCRTRS